MWSPLVHYRWKWKSLSQNFSLLTASLHDNLPETTGSLLKPSDFQGVDLLQHVSVGKLYSDQVLFQFLCYILYC